MDGMQHVAIAERVESLALGLKSVNPSNVQEPRTAFGVARGVVGVRGTVEVDGFPSVVV